MMKQHITLEQLNELINNDFNAFKHLIRILYKDIGKCDNIWIDDKEVHSEGFYTAKGNVIHLLSIGEMIEILHQKVKVREVNCFKISPFYHKWELSVYTKAGEIFIENTELADALWEAVKYALNPCNTIKDCKHEEVNCVECEEGEAD